MEKLLIKLMLEALIIRLFGFYTKWFCFLVRKNKEVSASVGQAVQVVGSTLDLGGCALCGTKMPPTSF